MSLCSYPTNKLVSTIAPDHHACILQLQLTRSHVFISCILSACMSVTVSSYQGPSVFHLHRTISHVCNNYIWQIPMSLTFASNHMCKLVHTSMHVFYTCSRPVFIFVIAISIHLCCMLHLQQTRK